MSDEIEDNIVEEESSEDSVLNLSDEDFLKSEFPTEVVKTEEVVETIGDEEVTTQEDEVITTPPVTDDNDTDIATDSVVDPVNTRVSDKSDVKDNIDYETEYKKLTAPFKANGSEMKVQSTEDAIALMQMGANYHKKMAGLKPSMKMLKLLEKNDLLDIEKLNYLIDLNNKNPDAITKLIQDSGIDPLDVNITDESEYRPTSRNVSDTEIELDTVLESIKDTPTYSKTLNVITSQWDDNSRATVANSPHIIAVINGHIADGLYDKVMGVVNYERSLGKLQGVSDLDAYKQTGDAMQAAGQFGPPPPTITPPNPTALVKPKNSTDDAERLRRKREASPTKDKGKMAPVTEYNPLLMSDEEIEKFDINKLPT